MNNNECLFFGNMVTTNSDKYKQTKILLKHILKLHLPYKELTFIWN